VNGGNAVIRYFAAVAFAASLAAAPPRVRTGELIGPNGLSCPLKNTAVKAEISGPLARVNVTQTFTNESAEKIEAVYVFPLPHDQRNNQAPRGGARHL
jgi:hypothetical protein